ncbi:unnamed protein product [Rotaria magnacalcarata]|uniref:Glycosyltransferase n=1 Tax=Rotaria magnacalcarata TaxID=392030 RepID=A0A815WQ84_9BILA|nr:unnamed protein product [Rotaria magnacalcarata]CAF1548267.1 unnamed protein product [Rotaria magnacalcarata]CAF3951574.1 unnamed protein product [Rotaria magnacalcarata]CAF3997120.1 unnamed protein product [Rotaria magnacalcarata]
MEADIDNNRTKANRKIFIPAIGTLGDVKPFLILAEQLKQRGHTVCLGTHKRFENSVKAAGIDSIEIGGDLEIILTTTPDGMEIRRNPSLLKIGLIKRTFASAIEEWFNGIMSGLKDADMIILGVGSFLIGLSCVEKFHNVKAVGIYTFPMLKTSEFSAPSIGGTSESIFKWINVVKWKIFEYTTASLYQDKVNQLRANVNLRPIKLNYYEMIQSIFHKPMLTATIYSKHLLSRPSDWQVNDLMVGPILEEVPTNFEPPSSICECLSKWKTEKIIYLGLGSMMSIMFGTDEQMGFLNNIQMAIENNNSKAVISLAGFQQAETDRLSNTETIFYLRQPIPHSWLFPNMSAAIHHGGAGTTHASLRYGLPSLILPFGADQPFNGDRVFVKRLGPRPIPIRQTNAKNLTKAVHDLITLNYNMYSANAKQISELIKNEDGLGECIRIIETELAQ